MFKKLSITLLAAALMIGCGPTCVRTVASPNTYYIVSFKDARGKVSATRTVKSNGNRELTINSACSNI